MGKDLEEVVKWLNQIFLSPSLLESRIGYERKMLILIFRPCVGCAMPDVTVATQL
jgi:hypothetical protein